MALAHTATSRARQTATTRARQTATTRARQTGTARVRQTATARARQTATEIYQRTATRASLQTATAQARTATAVVRRTATARAYNTRRTVTARARQTDDARQTAAANIQLTATAAASTAHARQTTTARALQTSYAQRTGTAHVRQQTGTAFAPTTHARRTATAQVRQAATAIAVDHPDIQITIREDRSNDRLRLRAQSNLSFGGRLEVAVHDYSRDVKKSYVVTFPSGQRGFLEMSPKFLFSGHPVRRKHLVEGLVVEFRTSAGQESRLICVRVQRTITFDRYSCNRAGGSFVYRQTATARARQLARTATAVAWQTVRVQRTGTAHVRHQTATAVAPTTHALRTATALSRQTAAASRRTATAEAWQTAFAQRTSTARVRQTATAQVRTATAQALTATSFARQTAYAQQTTTARALQTSYAQRTATIQARLQTAYVQRTETAVALSTSHAQRTGTASVRQTATAQARAATAIASPTPTATAAIAIRLEAPETYYVNQQVGVNARECPRYEANPCAIIEKIPYGMALTVVGEVDGEPYRGSTLWKVIEWNGQRLYIHASLLSLDRPAQPTQNDPGGSDRGSSSGSSGGSNSNGSADGSSGRASIAGCSGRTSAYIPGYCSMVKRVSGQCGFPRGDPNYSYERDSDDDGCACELIPPKKALAGIVLDCTMPMQQIKAAKVGPVSALFLRAP